MITRFSPRALVIAVVAGGLSITGLSIAPANAAEEPPAPVLPATATADALPTVQINGVVWDQAVVGNTVYAVGNFSSARPAGSAAGSNETARSNMLAYNLTTGALITTFAPTFNAQVRAVSASPDGSRIYVGGQFTTVNGVAKNRLAALNPTTGALITAFTPGANATVLSIHATSSAIYIGGDFTSVGGTARTKAAAINPANSAILPFAPAVADRSVRGIYSVNNKVAIGGNFTAVNGSNNPGYGLALLDASTGATLPTPVNNQVRNGDADAAIWSLTGDANGFYGSGYHFGGGGNLEGSFQADWDGNLKWIEDCHGDTYDVAPAGDVVYSASHKHYCGNIGTGGFPQTDPWSFSRATATTNFATGLSKADIYGYPDHPGQPSPTMLNFFPTINAGTFTGTSQGPWSVTTSGDYVLYAGEFTTVNNTGQQGLVRFAKRNIAPKLSGPRLSGATMNPSANSFATGTVRLSWPSNWDRDDSKLTYRVQRATANNVVYETTQDARFWEGKRMTFTDTGLTPGATVQYRIQTVDPDNNATVSGWVSVTVSATGSVGEYGGAVLEDGATKYWRMNEPSGSTIFDWAGADDVTGGSGIAKGAAGALNNSTDQASTFDGTTNGLAVSSELLDGPNVFSQEVWFKTTSTSGGKIVGFGSGKTGNSSSYDRHIYMDNSGRIYFGLYPGSSQTVQSSAGLNNGEWHQAVATVDGTGMALFIDGKRVSKRADVTTGQAYQGYWRVGGDNSWSGNPYFNGAIDEYSIYPTALTPAQVNKHWVASGRTSTIPTAPADAYGAKVFNEEPDLYWRLGESSGTTAADSGTYENPGTYIGNHVKGSTGVVAGNSAIQLQNGGVVVATKSASNPTVFSQEVWIKTNTNRGGRIFGFGNSNGINTSGNYDRHIYMLDDGTVRFGVYNGNTVTIDSAAALNDNAWHQVVSTFGPDGMKLYVDGKLDSTNPNTSAQNYSGYWKLGGDNAWGGNSDLGFTGDVDEAAVYGKVLTLAQIQDHFEAGGGTLPNDAPTAAFTATPTDLTVAFDSAGSADPDGTVASYAWDFGDGETSTNANPDHTYAAGGNYLVKLVVKDNRGLASAEVSHLVTVVAPNVKPTAGFTHTSNELQAEFTSTSVDTDGTLVSLDWDFGDGDTSTDTNPSHAFDAPGSYDVKLTVTDDRGGSDTITKQVVISGPNVAPTAAFTFTVDDLTANVDAGTSTDPDGTVDSYAWDFGDSTPTVTTQTASHTYAAPGSYDVKLTVKDNDNATSEVTTKTVTVVAPNVKPTAAFTSTVADAKVSLDASTSTDTDGTISSYAWEFGDGTNGTGVSPEHTYTTSGTYSVKLTVTDNRNGTDSLTKSVVVTVPGAPAGTSLAKDAFGRTLATGWGTADTGGAWTLTGTASSFKVDAGKGQIALPAAGNGRTALLNGVSSNDTDLSVDFSSDKAMTGGGLYVNLVGRSVNTSNAYRAKIQLKADGGARLDLVKLVGGAETTIAWTNVTGLTITPGQEYTARFQVTGTSPTTLKAKVWKKDQAEPSAWTLERTDTASELQVKGAVGFYLYLSGSATNAPHNIRFDNVSASTSAAAAPNVKPVAGFTSTVAVNKATLNASTSTDTDGTISAYAWNFGDATTGTGLNVEHTYAAAGTYDVTLTVTDDDGATDTLTKSVTVANPPAGAATLAEDNFGRTVAAGWGTADTGGAWTQPGSAANLTVGGGVGTIRLATAGSGPRAYLTGANVLNSDATIKVSLDKAPAGGDTYITLGARRSGTSEYRLKARFTPTTTNLYLTRLVNNVETTLRTATLPALKYEAGDTFSLRLKVVGSSPATLSGKLWKVGTSEPSDFQVTVTDSSSELAGAGSLVVQAFVSSAVTNAPVQARFDDLLVKDVP
ncbi:PKD domain-containing protein [soil metagenome]